MAQVKCTQLQAMLALRRSNADQVITKDDLPDNSAAPVVYSRRSRPAHMQTEMPALPEQYNLHYGALRLVKIKAKSAEEAGILMKPELASLVVVEVEPNSPGSKSQLIFEHDVVLMINQEWVYGNPEGAGQSLTYAYNTGEVTLVLAEEKVLGPDLTPYTFRQAPPDDPTGMIRGYNRSCTGCSRHAASSEAVSLIPLEKAADLMYTRTNATLCMQCVQRNPTSVRDLQIDEPSWFPCLEGRAASRERQVADG